MSLVYGGAIPGVPTISPPSDALLDNFSRQMATTQAARRLSRGSCGQRAGNAMRIVKPTSANNSPRSSVILARRRTLMNDGNIARRRQQAIDHVAMPAQGADQMDSMSRSSRPVSWHPSSFSHQQHLSPPPSHGQLDHPHHLAQYPFPSAGDSFHHQAEQYLSYTAFPPTPSMYSCHTSPSSTFSPLSLPFSTYDAPAFASAVDSWNLEPPPPPQQQQHRQHQQSASLYEPSSSSSETNGSHGFPEPFPTLPVYSAEGTTSSSEAAMRWNSFAAHGFSSTSPPTPETLPPAQQPQPVVPPEEAIPYQALDESEDEGEILVGMGLYDAPEKYEPDLQLDTYRSTISSLLGNTFHVRESMGKGLKLEESWQPPESDDEEGEGDEDADGEDQDESTTSDASAAQETDDKAPAEQAAATWI